MAQSLYQTIHKVYTKRSLNESATSVNKTKGAELADHIIEAAERVAGLISRRIESDPMTLSKLDKIDRTLSDIAYQLDKQIPSRFKSTAG